MKTVAARTNILMLMFLTQVISWPIFVNGQTIITQPNGLKIHLATKENILQQKINEEDMSNLQRFTHKPTNSKELNLQLEKFSQDKSKFDSLKERAMGGEVSGGGTSLSIKGQRRLLDVYFVTSSDVLSTENTNEFYGSGKISKIGFLNSHLESTIQNAIQNAGQVSKTLQLALQSIYLNTPFYFAEGRFKILDKNFYLDPKLSYPDFAKLSTSALNIRGVGVLVSRNDFLEMDQFNQAALVIHELIRYLQIQFSVSLKNSDIQNITHALMVSPKDLKNVIENSSLDFLVNGHSHLQIKQTLQTIAFDIKNAYGFTIALALDKENITLYEMANIASIASSDLLEFYIANRRHFTEAEHQHFEQLSDRLDKVVVEARSGALKENSSKAYSSMAEMQGAFRKSQSDFITECNVTKSSEECLHFFDILEKLIK